MAVVSVVSAQHDGRTYPEEPPETCNNDMYVGGSWKEVHRREEAACF